MDVVSVRELSRDVVTELAPRELPVFEVVIRTYLEHPRRTARMVEAGDDDPLGIGVDSLAAMVTTLAIVAASAVAGAVSQFVVENTYRGGRRLVRRMLGSRSRTEIEIAAIRALTVDQLAAVRQMVYERALAHGSDAEQAGRIANSVIAALVRRSGSDSMDAGG
jgi:hypothetical protein